MGNFSALMHVRLQLKLKIKQSTLESKSQAHEATFFLSMKWIQCVITRMITFTYSQLHNYVCDVDRFLM